MTDPDGPWLRWRWRHAIPLAIIALLCGWWTVTAWTR